MRNLTEKEISRTKMRGKYNCSSRILETFCVDCVSQTKCYRFFKYLEEHIFSELAYSIV